MCDVGLMHNEKRGAEKEEAQCDVGDGGMRRMTTEEESREGVSVDVEVKEGEKECERKVE